MFPKISNKQWLRLEVLSFPLRTVLCNIQYAAYFHTVWNYRLCSRHCLLVTQLETD